MSADLDAVAVGPPAVGAVDDRGGEPEHALGDLVEDLVLSRRRGGQRPVVRAGRADLHRRLELVEFVGVALVGARRVHGALLVVRGHGRVPFEKGDQRVVAGVGASEKIELYALRASCPPRWA